MKKLPILIFTLVLCALLPNPAEAHGHINAGAIDSNSSGSINAGDRLNMYFEPGTTDTSLVYNLGLTPYGADGYLWNGYTTFTALHQSSLPGEAPNYNSLGALSGSFLTLNLVSITGPTGAKLAFYDANATDPLWVYQIGTGLISGAGVFSLTEADWYDFSPSDPYGHIHGRMFGSDQSGFFTATWTLHDTQSGTTGLLDSLPFQSTFTATAVVPEPSTWALLILGGAGLTWMSRRRA